MKKFTSFCVHNSHSWTPNVYDYNPAALSLPMCWKPNKENLVCHLIRSLVKRAMNRSEIELLRYPNTYEDAICYENVGSDVHQWQSGGHQFIVIVQVHVYTLMVKKVHVLYILKVNFYLIEVRASAKCTAVLDCIRTLPNTAHLPVRW